MTKFITILIGASLALAAAAPAKQAEEQENPKNKKSKPVQQQQIAPKQQMAPKQRQMAPKQNTAPNPQVQAMPKQSTFHPLPKPIRILDTKPSEQNPTLQDKARMHDNDLSPKQHKAPTHQDKAKMHDNDLSPKQQFHTQPPVQSNNAPYVKPNKFTVKPNKPVIDPINPTMPVDKFKANKTVKNFQPKHQNFHAKVNSSVASVQFNQNFRIRNAENWHGNHYNAFRTYRPQWHDRGYWHSHHNHIILIGGGWYYWNAGYWYPAWGYDNSASYYPYDGPIYVGSHPRPFDQVVADVQSVLQEQGLYRGEVDGLVGPLTQEALAAYQSAQGLEPTAAIDQPTLESLGIS